ncbi:hypothetical protein [uncultured Hyphomicrobium sp.]|uniref:GGDEF domain-containing protein n=1 Tax=uncultured Hyphomicrobium sp. TaxID=194373 RepID=UPI003439C3F1
MARKICESFAATALPWGPDKTIRATVSIGVTATRDPLPSIEPLLNSAENALRQAKATGGNRVASNSGTAGGSDKKRKGWRERRDLNPRPPP